MTVIANPRGFGAPKFVGGIKPGSSLLQIVEEIQRRSNIPKAWKTYSQVQVNGDVVTSSELALYYPAINDNIIVTTSLHGGDNDNKNTMAVILTIAVMIYAPGAGAWITGSAVGTTAAAWGAAAFAYGAVLLINSTFPPRQPQLADQQGKSSPTYSITGARNDIRRFGAVPVILGTHRHTPPLGSASYTEILGSDEYLRMLVVWGYGPLKIDNIRIGDTPINSFTGVEIETIEGRDTDTPITLFSSVVSQDYIGALLTSAGGWISRTTAIDADEISFEVAFLRGLVKFDDTGQRVDRIGLVDAAYREVGDVTWIPIRETTSVPTQTTPLVGKLFYTVFNVRRGRMNIYIDYVTAKIVGLPRSNYPGQPFPLIDYDKISEIDWSHNEDTGVISIQLIVNYTAPRFTGLIVTWTSGGSVNVSSGTINRYPIRATAKTTSAVRKGYRIKVTRGQYEVRLLRIVPDTTDTKIQDQTTWTALRTITNSLPIQFKFPLALTALRIKATEQLSGNIDDLNADVSSYCQIWSGGNWDTEATTQNPAALYRHVLTSPANARFRNLSQIDDVALSEWYDFCVTSGYKFNMVRDAQQSVWDTLADIAATGRAAPSLSDGKWSVIIDIPDKPVRQHFTPRNSWGFQAVKTLPDAPHAWRVRFVNEQSDYKQDERLVFDDGYDENTATKFEGIEFPGITDPDLIWKFGRYYIAQLRLRPEEYTFSTDFEHLACERGNVILVSHDVPLWGLGWGRVKSVTINGGLVEDVTVDEQFVMEVGKEYNIRFRLEDGTSEVVDVDTVPGGNTTLTLTTPVNINVLKGDLCIFGEKGTETQRLIIKSIERGRDLTAKLVCVDESPAIYTSDTGTIPPFDTNITLPINVTDIPPLTPIISNVESGTLALVRIGGGFMSRILISLEIISGNIPVHNLRARWRIGTDDPWTIVTGDAEDTMIIIAPAFDGITYEIQAQAVSYHDIPSDWTDAVFETVIGQAELPPNVTAFSASIVGTDAHLAWDPVDAVDLSHYRIRVSPQKSGATWASAVDIVQRVVGTSVSVPAQIGTYLTKAVDYARNESAIAAATISTLAKLTGLNIVEATTEQNPTWNGVKDGVYYAPDSGGLVLAGEGDLYALTDLYAVSDLYTYATLVDIGYYYLVNTTDLGAIYTSRLTGEIDVAGVNFTSDLYIAEDLYTLENLYDVSESSYSAGIELRTTDDDPSGTPVWSDWRRLIVGDFSARAYQFRVKLNGDDQYISPVVSRVYVEVDMPDRLYRFSALIPIGGDRIDFDPPFYDFPGDRGLGISVFNGQEGDKYTITNLDKTGFDIAFTNSGGNVARSVSGIAQSYGELII